MTIGVVVMTYGTPSGPDEILAYYTHIRRGRPPTSEQLNDLRGRYEALGGVSRLRERTQAQCTALRAALETRAPNKFQVSIGQRHAAPFIADAVKTLTSGPLPCHHIIGLVLAPHFSRFSVGQYAAELSDAAQSHGATSHTIEHWFDLPAYQEFLARAVASARDAISTPTDATKVFFTAHSLPERLLVDDPYPDQLLRGARAVATQLGLVSGAWDIAWQSAGATGDVWRGPDILDVIRELAATSTTQGVIVCPHGFTADHLEVAYDLDIEARQFALAAGLAFARTEVLNDDPVVFGALAEWIELAAGGS